ncbi:probable G-protein coupled receptor 82 isoform X2 [Trachinotus anak]|uniref:probable G-protein coupled receptor 82 isoform X2 n=2 Tax=Trachinotus anak TaxID=443729 RepID=UPI0039F21DF8
MLSEQKHTHTHTHTHTHRMNLLTEIVSFHQCKYVMQKCDRCCVELVHYPHTGCRERDRCLWTDQMDHTPYSPPPGNVSSSSSVLCPSAATHFFLPSVYTLLFLTALPGNALSLWVFLRRISTTSSTHVYLSHLSISNLLLSFTTPFLAAYFAWGSVWTRSGVLCQLVLHAITPVLHINIYISLMILTWVALSRFAALIQRTHASRPSTCKTLLPHTFYSSLRRVSFARRVCATVWAVAVGGIVPVTVYYSVKEAVGDGEAETGGWEVCYSPAVEIGGSLSSALVVPVITIFFLMYLLVLLSYMTVLRHIRRSRHSTNVTTSQSLLGRVLRNIVVIQVVLSVCLLPYHIFKPIFISLAHYNERTHPPATDIHNHCHPLSTFVEVKNCLFLLAALRGSTDPAMYFLLDKTFRHQALVLLRCSRNNSEGRVTGSPGQKTGQLGDGNTATATMDSSRESAL